MRDEPTDAEAPASRASTSDSGDNSLPSRPTTSFPAEPQEQETRNQPSEPEAHQPLDAVAGQVITPQTVTEPAAQLFEDATPARQPSVTAQVPAWSRPVHLMLTEEELTVILRGLQAESLPGFHPAWAPNRLVDRFEREGEGHLESATRSLVAHGILIPPGQPGGVRNAWTIPAAIYGLIGTCAFADVSLHLQARIAQTSHDVYLHGLEDVAVRRASPTERIHDFAYLGSQAQLVSAVGDFFAIRAQQAVEQFPAFRITAENFQAVRTLIARGQRDQAERLLQRHKCGKEAARRLCEALAETRVTGTITLGRYEHSNTTGTPRSSGGRPVQILSWALMVAPTTIFVLTDESTPSQRQYGAPQLIIYSVGADDMLQGVAKALHGR